MTSLAKLDVLITQGYKITIRYGKMWSVKNELFDGYRVHATDEVRNGWIGEGDTLAKTIEIVYKKVNNNPPRVKF